MAINRSKHLHDSFENFLETHPPREFGIFLRKMVMEYIRERIGIGFSLDFPRYLWALEDLLELLDSAELDSLKNERAKRPSSQKRSKQAGK